MHIIYVYAWATQERNVFQPVNQDVHLHSIALDLEKLESQFYYWPWMIRICHSGQTH